MIVFTDYDLTLAEKDVHNFHRAPLTRQQYEGISKLAPRLGRFVVVTARGEESTLSYLQEHGRLENVALASNSGYLLREDIAATTKPQLIPIPGYQEEELNRVTETINYIIDALYKKFPHITVDRRELCGAVIYQFKGDEMSPEHTALHALTEEAWQRAGDSGKIILASKHRQVETSDGIETQGYIDIKPLGMDKGFVTGQLFQHYATTVAEPFVIVAGDSDPDYAMMEAIDKLVLPENRVFISVGPGLKASDAAHKKQYGYELLDLVLEENGRSPIESLHQFFAEINNINETGPQAIRSLLARNEVSSNPVSQYNGYS